MKVQTFRNMKGLIHGGDPKRISCDKTGVLKIGTTELALVGGKEDIMPLLFHGCDGDYPATFTDEDGAVFELEKVAVRGGRIEPPHPTAVEFMELRCRVDEAEALCETLRQEVVELSKIFDTDALNFLLK
jgi:hypothetical protein